LEYRLPPSRVADPDGIRSSSVILAGHSAGLKDLSDPSICRAVVGLQTGNGDSRSLLIVHRFRIFVSVLPPFTMAVPYEIYGRIRLDIVMAEFHLTWAGNGILERSMELLRTKTSASALTPAHGADSIAFHKTAEYTMRIAVRFGMFLLVCFIVLVYPPGLSAEDHWRVSFGGYAAEDCRGDAITPLLAGGQCNIILKTYGYGDSLWLPSGPPPDLQWTAWKQSDGSSSALESQRLISELNPRFYVTKSQGYEAKNRSDFPSSSGLISPPAYYFLVDIPTYLANDVLCVRASFTAPGGSRVADEGCQAIVAPCSKTTRDQALGTCIAYAYDSGDPQHAVFLTDSLLEAGWSWWAGLDFARRAAWDLARYDRSIEYLDIMYQKYGRVSFIGPKNPANDEAIYQRMRNQLLELRSQQEQRH
jgi:hypothetical protein